MRKLSSRFHSYPLIYGSFEDKDLRNTTQPSAGFWKAFRRMLRTMQPVKEERCVTGCLVEFEEERWELRLSTGPQPSVDMQSTPNEEIFGELKKLAKKRIRPYWIEVYEYWAKVLFCIGPFSPGKTKYVVTIYRVRK